MGVDSLMMITDERRSREAAAGKHEKKKLGVRVTPYGLVFSLTLIQYFGMIFQLIDT
jgi:hypothetical protein